MKTNTNSYERFIQMLSKFNNQVLSQGPDAVLPQNLSAEWLNVLQKMAEDFLDSSYDLDECKEPGDVADPVLTVCVLEILRSQPDVKSDIPDRDILEKVTIYSLSLIMETVHREVDIGLKPPTLENILSWDRIIKLKDSNPDFIQMLEQACIYRGSKTGWFHKIKGTVFPNH
ncbi:MAG: hypothetical protein JSW04_08850 [Desulfobacterales bacterium]|nr:MAG: hypothetical protein JSW04_08850 [Desulfobacterales bacterium]